MVVCPHTCTGSSIPFRETKGKFRGSDEADGSSVTIALGRADRRSRSAQADPAWAQIQGVGENHCRIPKAGFPAVQVVGSSPPQRHHLDRFHTADLSAACAKSLNHALWQPVVLNRSVFLQPLPSSCAKYQALWPNPAATKRTKRDRYSLSATICREADTPMRRVPRQAFVGWAAPARWRNPASVRPPMHPRSAQAPHKLASVRRHPRCSPGKRPMGRCSQPNGVLFLGVGTKRPRLLAGLFSRWSSVRPLCFAALH